MKFQMMTSKETNEVDGEEIISSFLNMLFV